MFHTCVERFDVTSTVGKILGTKRGPRKSFGQANSPASAADIAVLGDLHQALALCPAPPVL